MGPSPQVPLNASLSGNSGFAGALKLRSGREGGLSSKMTGVLTGRGEETQTGAHREEERAMRCQRQKLE